jgi:cell division GTPase FtsZ
MNTLLEQSEDFFKDANAVVYTAEETARGEAKCLTALKQALSKLLPDGKVPAKCRFLLNFCGDVSLQEVNEAVTYLKGLSEPEVSVLSTCSTDEDEQNEQAEVSVLVLMAQGK